MSVDDNRDVVGEENNRNKNSIQRNAELNLPRTSHYKDGWKTTDVFSSVSSPTRTEYSMNSYTTASDADAGQVYSRSDNDLSASKTNASTSSLGGKSYCSIGHSSSNFWNKEIVNRPRSGKLNPITGERSGGDGEGKLNLAPIPSTNNLLKDVNTGINSISPISSTTLIEETKSNIGNTDSTFMKHPTTMVRRNPITGEGMELRDCETNSNNFLRSGLRIKQPPGGISSGIF